MKICRVITLTHYPTSFCLIDSLSLSLSLSALSHLQIMKYSQNMFECDFMFIAEEVKTINFMITTLQPHLPKYLRKIADNNVIMILLI